MSLSLPQPSDEVEVLIAGGAVAAARVLAPRGDNVRLTWLEPARAFEGAATLHFVNRRGLLCLTGRLAQESGRIARFRPDGPPTLVQRREAVRVDLLAPVRCLDFADATGHVLDIGAAGFLMHMRARLAIGQVLRFALELPDAADPLEITGEICRRAGGDTWGVAMRGLSAREEDRLVRLIFARQRLALRMTRDG